MSAGAARRLDALLSCAELPEIPDLAWHIAEALSDLSQLELKDYEASLLRQMAYLQLQYRRCAVLRPPTPEGGAGGR